jgi:hypothetical protein
MTKVLQQLPRPTESHQLLPIHWPCMQLTRQIQLYFFSTTCCFLLIICCFAAACAAV